MNKKFSRESTMMKLKSQHMIETPEAIPKLSGNSQEICNKIQA